MAAQKKSKKPHVQKSAETPRKEQSKLRRFLTILISVIVALGLMIPVAGIGAASCSANVDDAGLGAGSVDSQD